MIAWQMRATAMAVVVTGAALSARGDALYVATVGGIGRFNADGTFDLLVTDPGDGSVLVNPDAIAFDAAGNMYFANNPSPDPGNPPASIQRVTPSGVVSLFTNQGLSAPRGLAFDTAGNLYVANARSATIKKITPAGVASTFATLPQYSLPAGMVFDAVGNLFVSTSFGFDKITPGGVVTEFNSEQDSWQPYYGPMELAIDPQGNLYEANEVGGVFEFAPDGTRTTFVSGVIFAGGGIARDAAGDIFVSQSDHPLLEFNPGGVEVRSFNTLPYPYGDIDYIVIRPDAPTPEPGTAAMLGAAAAVGICRRRAR